MLVLPELQLESVLKRGFAAIAAQSDLLDDIFYNYPPEMLAEVKTYLKRHDLVKGIVLNWPREGFTMPTIAIVNAGDSEDAQHDTLGDVLEELTVGNNDASITEYRGIAKNGTYQILCLSQDPRLSMYIAYLVETILILNSPALQETGMHNMMLNSADLRFEEQLLPEWANSRMVTVTCLHYHAVPVTERLLNNLCVLVTVETSNNGT